MVVVEPLNRTFPPVVVKVISSFNVIGPVNVWLPLPLEILAAKVIPPVLLKTRLPLVVRPTVFTVPIAKPLFSKKETVPVLPARVVIALELLLKV